MKKCCWITLFCCNLKPDTSYVFLVRAVTPNGVISQPSPLSDKVMTLSLGRSLPEHDTNQVRAKFSHTLLSLTTATAISPTAVTLHWTVRQDEQYISGYHVKHQEEGGLTNATVVHVRRGSSSSYTVFGLKKYTAYEMRLAPVYRDIVGKESNALIARTLSDGELQLSSKNKKKHSKWVVFIHLHFFVFGIIIFLEDFEPKM